MRSIAVCTLAWATMMIAGCPRAAAVPATPETADPSAADNADAPEGPAPAASDPDAPTSFGYRPGDVAVVSWTHPPGATEGPAALRLPNGEQLEGTWRVQDNAIADAEAGGRVESTDPRGDPGDPSTMPGGHPHSRQIVIELSGNRGTKVRCTIPTRGTGVGHCRDEHRRFDARLR